jgi:PAS domain S-box-containing protein
MPRVDKPTTPLYDFPAMPDSALGYSDRAWGPMIRAVGRSVETLLLRVRRARESRGSYLVVLWLVGSATLAIATWACFVAGLNSSAASCAFLIIIVLLSLFDSFISSVIFSVIAVLCLDYFFIRPLLSLDVAQPADVLALIAFVLTAFVVTGLVRRLRDMADRHLEQVRLLNLTHDSIFVRDKDDMIVFWNRGAQELYGWRQEDTAGRTTHDLLRTRFPSSLDAINQELLRTGRWEGELVHARRDGTQITVSSRWSLQRDLNGQPVGTLETNTDITQRKRAEEALKRSQATYLAEAQRLSATGSFGWNTTTGEIVWSEQSFRIFGYPPSVTPSMDAVFERVHPDDRSLVHQVIDRAIGEKQDFDLEHRLLLPDGSVTSVHVVARAVIDDQGGLQFMGAVMDITAARRAQEQLQQAQAELAHVTRVMTLGELTASIAHEVNQPLAAIVTNGDAIVRFLNLDPPLLGEVADAARRMISDGKRASAIVQRIRALVKKTEPQSAPVDLNAIITESVSLVRLEVANHGAALRLDLAPGLPAVLGDGVQLQQVMTNLIMNGVQAMTLVQDRARDMRIRSHRDEAGNVIVSVQDSGAGIDPANADRLFDAFYTTKASGMGVGLSICRTIIQAHGGRIYASPHAGPGATFRFSLPPISDAAS